MAATTSWSADIRTADQASGGCDGNYIPAGKSGNLFLQLLDGNAEKQNYSDRAVEILIRTMLRIKNNGGMAHAVIGTLVMIDDDRAA